MPSEELYGQQVPPGVIVDQVPIPIPTLVTNTAFQFGSVMIVWVRGFYGYSAGTDIVPVGMGFIDDYGASGPADLDHDAGHKSPPQSIYESQNPPSYETVIVVGTNLHDHLNANNDAISPTLK
jgi:hypothetical protein